MEKTKGATLLDSIKLKLIEVATDYVKANLQKTQKEIVKYAQKQIEIKIKKEVKKVSYKIAAYSLLGLGVIFFVYGLFSLASYLLNLPTFTTNLAFGGFLLIIGFVIWMIYN